jgi:hypothetical protein
MRAIMPPFLILTARVRGIEAGATHGCAGNGRSPAISALISIQALPQLWPTTSPLPRPLRCRLHGQMGTRHPERIGYRLMACRSARARKSRFFGCATSSASRRISFSRVFFPSSRCSSRVWCCKAPVFGRGHDFLASPNSRQRAPGVEPTPNKHLVWRDPRVAEPPATPTFPARRSPRLLFRRPAPSPLYRRNDVKPVDIPSHKHGHTPGS